MSCLFTVQYNIPSNVRGQVQRSEGELEKTVNDNNQPNQIFLTKPNTSYG